jgi:hypothetical protein
MDWQQPLALAIVALAAIWLVRTQILASRRGGCGGCGTCGSAGSAESVTPRSARGRSSLIQIELDRPGSAGSSKEASAPPSSRRAA